MIPKNREFKKRNFSQSIFFSVFLVILVLIITGFLVISNLKINQKRAQFRSQIEALKKELQILEEKNQKLKAGISESQSETYLEKKARESLGLKKPGEEVVVVLPPKEEENKENKEKKNFWQKLLDPVRNFFEF